jgi:hypothetical protein
MIRHAKGRNAAITTKTASIMEVREHYASGGRKFAMMSKVIVAPTPKKVGRSVPYITMQSVQPDQSEP